MNLVPVELFARSGAKGVVYWCAANFDSADGTRRGISVWGAPGSLKPASALFQLPQKSVGNPLSLQSIKSKKLKKYDNRGQYLLDTDTGAIYDVDFQGAPTVSQSAEVEPNELSDDLPEGILYPERQSSAGVNGWHF